mmetsp:Transcript_40177/g.74324  ORF Transcript_40177/g.74324 Transcript_40177/m.74324 type:complete len:81 (+) Transcript_40177:276-518(+)
MTTATRTTTMNHFAAAPHPPCPASLFHRLEEVHKGFTYSDTMAQSKVRPWRRTTCGGSLVGSCQGDIVGNLLVTTSKQKQ